MPWNTDRLGSAQPCIFLKGRTLLQTSKPDSGIPTDSRKKLALANLTDAYKRVLEANRMLDRAKFLARTHGASEDEMRAVAEAVK